MPSPYHLFEVSWEVCNKVGGIHTVLTTKAKTLVARFGDDYVLVGPWLLSGAGGGAPANEPFEEEAGFEAFCESCRALGVPVRVGRWRIPGRPRTILVEFSGLFAKKDAVLAGLWENYKVDSLFGGWDYVEPLMFGHAAGIVIEKWVRERSAPSRRRAVAQFHEWMTGSGMLYLHERAPDVGTVFTTHATMLGRSIASTGKQPIEGLAGRTPAEAADAIGIRSKHSIENACAREADVFTTVSEITAREAEIFFGRRAAPLLPNGIDLAVIDELAGPTTRQKTQATLRDLSSCFFGEDASQAALVAISGRYEFVNKGMDLLLDAAADLARRPGRPVVIFALVPAGNSGVRAEVNLRLRAPPEQLRGEAFQGPIERGVLSTHNLFDPEHDPIRAQCEKLGLTNARGSRVKVIHVPTYCAVGDGLLDLPYEAVLRGMDLTCFPSFYEPWGYTPEESLAVGVPTVTTDCAGFGRWALEQGLGPERGVYVLAREGVEHEAASARLAELLGKHLAESRDPVELARTCRDTARLTAWSDLVSRYLEAFERAVEAAAQRAPLASFASSPALRPRVAVSVAPAPEGQRPRLSRFGVSATIPDALAGLERLARNLWWSWDAEATALFRELYPAKWETSRHCATSFLRDVYPEDLAAKAADASYLARVRRVLQRFDQYMAAPAAELRHEGGPALSVARPAAYFCAEFGVHESLRIYSGGLGVLAGDHLKSASDLRLPLVGVGLFYRTGYLQQRLTAAGDQIAVELENDPRGLPLEEACGKDGQPLRVELQLPSSRVVLRAWRARVGRVDLYLLDSNVPENRPEDRDITRQLYGGDHETRLRQEIVLGRGGVRLLERLSIEPAVWHVNEGHAAFLVVERAGRMVRELGLTFDEAREIVRASTVFTTHTPVPAGHDRFDEDLMRRYFSDAPASFGLPWERFWQLGLSETDRETFNMTYLALAFASFVNGVSRLHGQVSRKLLHPYWPQLLEGEVPVRAITNGVHLPTWTDPAIGRLLGVEGRPVAGTDFERGAAAIDDRALWDARSAARDRMLARIRSAHEQRFLERGDSPTLLNRVLDGLDPRALWIGFARRFAPYKRAQLLLRDPARLARILSSTERPARLVFAGKAHPNDRMGQDILKRVALAERAPELVGRVFFVEDYDVDVARALVQGVDVWLNNPIRPMEASGTSGMKVAANGGLNLSVLDGWWIEACDGKNGWAIGAGRVYPTQELQDELDGDHLYRLLEEEILPLFHARAGDGLPHAWIERVKHSLATIPPAFDTDRMVAEYRDRAYVPLAARGTGLQADRAAGARSLAQHHARVRKGFADVRILGAHGTELAGLRVGDVMWDPLESTCRHASLSIL